jgi:hypothetical protein
MWLRNNDLFLMMFALFQLRFMLLLVHGLSTQSNVGNTVHLLLLLHLNRAVQRIDRVLRHWR